MGFSEFHIPLHGGGPNSSPESIKSWEGPRIAGTRTSSPLILVEDAECGAVLSGEQAADLDRERG